MLLNAGNNDENIGIRERETLQVLTEIRDNQASQVNGAAILDQSVGYAVTDKNEGDHDVTLARPTFIATSDDGRIVQEETLYNGKGGKVLYFVLFEAKTPRNNSRPYILHSCT